MAAIADIIARGKGTAGAWRVTREFYVTLPSGESFADVPTFEGALKLSAGEGFIVETASLHHHATRMLRWNLERPEDSAVLDWSLGWGSVSDQNGMNTAFRLLGLPYYFSRKGGAEILSLNVPAEAKRMPRYLWNRGERRTVEYVADREAADKRLEAAKEEADKLGADAGVAAGSWAVDGNSTEEHCRALLAAADNCELDIPAPLSGEWAGDTLPADVLASVAGGTFGEDHPAADEILSAFEAGYSRGYEEEATRAARAMLPADEPGTCRACSRPCGSLSEPLPCC